MAYYFTQRDGRKAYQFMVLTGGADPSVLVRRSDLRGSKWSSGNVTPAQRAWALAQLVTVK